MNNKPERNSLQNAIAVLCAFMMCLSVLASPAFALKAHAEPNDYQPPLALKTLWEQNHHVIGGLFIPGTTVCYPILQHPSIDDYYLNVCLAPSIRSSTATTCVTAATSGASGFSAIRTI